MVLAAREGLQSLDEDDDMLTAMARELVTENGVGDSAAAVWRQIQAENSNLGMRTTITSGPASVVEDAPLTTSLITPALTEAAVEALKFGIRPPSGRQPIRQREPPPLVDRQFPLF
jgi:hypothetical protein